MAISELILTPVGAETARARQGQEHDREIGPVSLLQCHVSGLFSIISPDKLAKSALHRPTS